MRRKTLFTAVTAVVFAVALVVTGTHRAYAINGSPIQDSYQNTFGVADQCLNDPNNAPNQQNQQNFVTCNASNPAQYYVPAPSSYGSGWYSIELDTVVSGHRYCLSAGAYDGAPVIPVGCNGGAAQAWKVLCVESNTGDPNHFTYPEFESAQGYSLNDYGGLDNYGDHAAVWHFENPAPASLIMYSNTMPQPECTVN